MMKKIFRPLIFSVSLFCIFLLWNACCSTKQKTAASALLKICPDEWIKDKMPGPGANEGNEYFILEGKRRELKEFDTEWIKQNCNVKPQIVQ